MWLRIARKRGIPVQNLLGDEFDKIKQMDRDQNREKEMASLDDYFKSDGIMNERPSR